MAGIHYTTFGIGTDFKILSIIHKWFQRKTRHHTRLMVTHYQTFKSPNSCRNCKKMHDIWKQCILKSVQIIKHVWYPLTRWIHILKLKKKKKNIGVHRKVHNFLLNLSSPTGWVSATCIDSFKLHIWAKIICMCIPALNYKAFWVNYDFSWDHKARVYQWIRRGSKSYDIPRL